MKPEDTFAEQFVHPSYKWIGERRFVTNAQGWRISNYPGGVGFAFYNYSDRKGLRVHLRVTREDGTCEVYLTDAYCLGEWGDNWQKWQTHRLPLFPYESLHGRAAYVTVSFHIVKDGKAIPSRYEYKFAILDEFQKGRIDGGDFDDPLFKKEADFDAAPVRKADVVRALGRIKGDFKGEVIRPFFTRGNTWSPHHPIHEIHKWIDRVIERKQKDRRGRHYIHLAMFDFDNEHVANHLVYAKEQGVDVECIGDWAQVGSMNCSEHIARIRRSGIPVYGVVRNGPGDPREGIASMHTKFIIFDGEAVHSSSYNLHFHLWGGNWENSLFYYSRDYAQLYAQIYSAVKGGSATFRGVRVDPSGRYNLYYSFGAYETDSGWLRPQDAIITEVNNARSSILVCMFSLSHLYGRSLGTGHEADVIQALIDARDRGVRVRILLNGLVAHAGREPAPWDKRFRRPLKEPIQRLKDAWMEVYHVYYWESIHSPLHHKFAVFDDYAVITESYNWYEASLQSDETLSVIRDQTIAGRFTEEAELMLRTFRIERE